MSTTDDQPTTLTVYPGSASGGPVHVGDGRPLCHPDTREVTDSPLIRALIASGRLRQAPPANDVDDGDAADQPNRKTPGRGRRQETT
jgi:hypothetical protein